MGLMLPQVDATWYGHVHSYSRTCPVFQRNCMGFADDGTANAPVHLLIGHAGPPIISPLTCLSSASPLAALLCVSIRARLPLEQK